MDVKYAFLGIFGMAILVVVAGSMGDKNAARFSKDPLRRNIEKAMKEQAAKQNGPSLANLNGTNAVGLAEPSVLTATNPDTPPPTLAPIPGTLQTGSSGAALPLGMMAPPAPPQLSAGAPPFPSVQSTDTQPPLPAAPTPANPYTPPTATPAAPAGTQPAPNNGGMYLSTGERVVFSGTHVYIAGLGGQLQPMPDGRYTLKNGQPLVVQQGKRQLSQ